MKTRTKITAICALIALSLTFSACGQRKPLIAPQNAAEDTYAY